MPDEFARYPAPRCGDPTPHAPHWGINFFGGPTPCEGVPAGPAALNEIMSGPGPLMGAVTDQAPGVSEWCAQDTITIQRSTDVPGVWEDVEVSGHAWCASQRWHDEYHGKDPGCCASDAERASWACTCPCHVATDQPEQCVECETTGRNCAAHREAPAADPEAGDAVRLPPAGPPWPERSPQANGLGGMDMADCPDRELHAAHEWTSDTHGNLWCIGARDYPVPPTPPGRSADETGGYPCSNCETPSGACLDELNRTGRRCCEACGLNPVHDRPAQSGRSADEIRAAIREALCSTRAAGVNTSPLGAVAHHDNHQHFGLCALCMGDADTLADALMDGVVNRLIAEQKRLREMLTEMRDRLDGQRQRAERAEQQLIDCGADRDEQQRRASRAASMYSALRTQMRALCTCRATNDADGPDEDCPVHGRDEFRAPVIARRLAEVEAERDRLRESLTAAERQRDAYRTGWEQASSAVERVRALPDHWRNTVPDDLHDAAADLESALDGTDQEARDE